MQISDELRSSMLAEAKKVADAYGFCAYLFPVKQDVVICTIVKIDGLTQHAYNIILSGFEIRKRDIDEVLSIARVRAECGCELLRRELRLAA